MSNISNIDDLLMGVGNTQQAMTPEHKDKLQKEGDEKPQKAPIEEMDDDVPTYDDTDDSDSGSDDSNKDMDESGDSSDDDDKLEQKTEKKVPDDDDEDVLDDYGNKKERLPKGMRDRLERKEKQHQREIDQRDHELQILRQQLSQKGASHEVQQAAKDFKYDPEDGGSWQEQLTDFVKQTVNNMTNEQQQKELQTKEQHVQREFQQKFTKGMDRFGDFREIVGSQPIDDAMTLSLRAMSDPSAFIYAASKRHPQELERISKLPDPYVRMVEMGRLEERMRKNKSATQTPRPLGRVKEDATTKVISKQRDATGDDLLAKADVKRLSVVRSRHKSNR